MSSDLIIDWCFTYTRPIVEWYRSVNGTLFSGFLTSFIFIFGTKLHLILLLKEKIYDTAEYYNQQKRKENECCKDYTKHIYDQLRNLNKLFRWAEGACFIAAICQYTIPYIPFQPIFTFLALTITIICATTLVVCIMIASNVFTDYLKNLKRHPSES